MSLFVETDVEATVQELLNDFEAETGTVLAASDQRRIFLMGFAYALAVFRNDLEETGKLNLLRYSTGEALDAIGELMGVGRNATAGAKCTLKFTLSAVQASAVYIPAGTRATPDGNLFFATDEALVIAAGEQSGSVEATCTMEGESGNGYVPGQIATLVDGVTYVSAVANTTESSGGADEESDDDMRKRIREAPFSFSTCGPAGAYQYWAISASPDVGDVAVDSPSAGTVRIAVIKSGGVIPESTDAVLKEVSAACSASDRRPLTDHVSVVPATAVATSIALTYYVSNDDIGQLIAIQEAVTAAVEEYKAWQMTSIGKDINPDRLHKMVMDAGASRCTITSPVYTEVTSPGVAQFATADSITFGGMSE